MKLRLSDLPDSLDQNLNPSVVCLESTHDSLYNGK